MRYTSLLKLLRRAFSYRWLTLSCIIVKESIFKTLSRTAGREDSLLQKIIYTFMLPDINDGILVYNAKWFLAGLIAGLLISVWIPLVSYSFSIMGSEGYVEDLLTVYITFIFFISIIIIIDLVHQVISSFQELRLTEPLVHMPIDSRELRKAIAYSGLFGGGYALVLGISIAVAIIAYTHLFIPNLLIYIPVGVTNTFLIVYPLSIYLYSRLYRRIPAIVSLFIYILLISSFLTLYLILTGYVFKVKPVAYMLLKYSYIYPINYVVLSLGINHVVPVVTAIVVLALGFLLLTILPMHMGYRFIYEKQGCTTIGLTILIRHGMVLSIALKDVLLMFRSSLRLRQFYGQSIAFILPVALLLLYPGSDIVVSKLELFTRLYVFSYLGILFYIVTAIVSPTIVFVEGIDSLVNYYTPVSIRDIMIGKSIASLILLQPAILVIALITGLVTLSIVDVLVVLYSMNAYSLLASLLTNYFMLSPLADSPRAWSELSIGILRRILYTFIIVTIMFLIIPLSIIVYIIEKPLGLIVQLLIPLPAITTVLYRVLVEMAKRL